MIDPRAVALQGIGYGPALIAAHGFGRVAQVGAVGGWFRPSRRRRVHDVDEREIAPVVVEQPAPVAAPATSRPLLPSVGPNALREVLRPAAAPAVQPIAARQAAAPRADYEAEASELAAVAAEISVLAARHEAQSLAAGLAALQAAEAARLTAKRRRAALLLLLH